VTARDFPHFGYLREGHEGVVPVGVHPKVTAPASVDGHELAVVDARAVGQGQVHPMALELLQLYPILPCHGGLRLRRLCVLLLCFGREARGS
jgi:hypothetical protein